MICSISYHMLSYDMACCQKITYGRVYFVSAWKGIDQGNFWGMRFVRRGHPKFGEKKATLAGLALKKRWEKKWGISQEVGSTFSWFEHGMNNPIPYSEESTYLATPERSKWVQEAGKIAFAQNDKKQSSKQKTYHIARIANLSRGHFLSVRNH